MKPVICNDVQRDNGIPLYTVKVYNLDNPVNFHSYDCIFFKQGHNLEQLESEAKKAIIHYGEKPIEPNGEE